MGRQNRLNGQTPSAATARGSTEALPRELLSRGWEEKQRETAAENPLRPGALQPPSRGGTPVLPDESAVTTDLLGSDSFVSFC